MGQIYPEITTELQNWLSAQRMFFVATAPLAASGHVNCSPKGTDSFRVLGPHEVAYLDLTGSGVETIAHLRENQRVVLMFCAFSGPPLIVRLYGRGVVHEPDDPAFPELAANFPPHPATRAVIRVAVDRISDACGHGVPLYDYVADRDFIERWATKKGPDGIAAYRAAKNERSVDGLPGLRKR